MEGEMKTRSLIAVVAALSLSILAVTAAPAFAAKVVEIQGKYTKIKLDGICAANGGNSYGTAGGTYGCTKGNVSVECQNDGSCKGYIFMQAASHGSRAAGSPDAVLQQSEAPTARGTVGGAAGGVLTQQ
jgi:hypothetical protein